MRTRSSLGASLVAVALAAAALAPRAASAQEKGKTYSPYEKATLDAALAKLGAEIDPEPQGKTIESIETVRLPVFEDRDPAPGFLNWFHVTSLPYTIKREALVSVGEPWDDFRVEETARNLRDLRQVSIVLVAALKGSSKDRVRFVIITKDVWSIRLNTDFQFAGGKLQYLLLQPSEENVLGTHHSANAQFTMDPGTFSFGGGYKVPRVAGSRIGLALDGGVILNRSTGATEGSYGDFSYGQPLYSADTEWAWGASISWRDQVARRFIGGELATYDARATATDDQIPYEYRSDRLSGDVFVTRSFGHDIKHDFSVGLSASRALYRHYDLSAYAPAAAAEFAAQLPVSDTSTGPTIGYHTYANEFLSVINLETLGLQEDYRLGHDVYVSFQPVAKAWKASRDYVGFSAGAQHTSAIGNGLLRVYATTALELAKDVPDSSFEVGTRFVTPSLGIGRFVFDGFLHYRFTDYLNSRSSIGGDGRLRGYPTNAFIGKNAVAYNFEFRTRPIEILSVQLGGAAFLDAGDAFDVPEEMNIKYSSGFGLRLLFPQVDRVVLRGDWGFPLDGKYYKKGAFPGDIVVTFQQAFGLPSIH